MIMPFNGGVTGNYSKQGNKLILFCDITDDLKTKPSDTVSLSRYFSHKGQVKYVLNYTLPPGASVENLPENINFTSEGGNFKCNMSYSMSGNTLVYTKEIEVNTLLLEEENIKEWWDYVYVQKKFEAIHVEVTL